MTEQQEIITLLQEINCKLDRVINEPQFMKIPAASKHFRLSEEKLRELCEKGIISATLTNEAKVRKHWIINVVSARKELEKGGYIKLMMDRRAPRKRKVSIN
jgi:hypothetical protein